jgi:hypothetical protein
VLTNTDTGNQTNAWILLRANGVFTSAGRHYDEKDNMVYVTSTGETQNFFMAGTLNRTSGVISDFAPKTAFHALDYNDKGTIAGWAMPGKNYVNITIGASNSDYIAPADGYVYLYPVFSTYGYLNIFVYKENGVDFLYGTTGDYNHQAYHPVVLPVRKGAKYTIIYYDVSDWLKAYFVYTNVSN